MLRLIAALLADRFELPAARAIDARLIAGGALFGIGGSWSASVSARRLRR
jgi:hypothetical protein